MKTITINEQPHNQKCTDCSFMVQLSASLVPAFGEHSSFCLANADAETCALPEIASAIQNKISKLPGMDFRGALRARRRQLADSNCSFCGGYGETINLIDQGTIPCPCTKQENSGTSA